MAIHRTHDDHQEEVLHQEEENAESESPEVVERFKCLSILYKRDFVSKVSEEKICAPRTQSQALCRPKTPVPNLQLLDEHQEKQLKKEEEEENGEEEEDGDEVESHDVVDRFKYLELFHELDNLYEEWEQEQLLVAAKSLGGQLCGGEKLYGEWKQDQRLREARMEHHLGEGWALDKLIEEQLSRFDAHYSRTMGQCKPKDVSQLLIPKCRLPLELVALAWVGNWRPSAILSVLQSISRSSSGIIHVDELDYRILSQLIHDTRIEEAKLNEEMAETQATCILHPKFNKLRYKTFVTAVENLLTRTQADEFMVAFAVKLGQLTGPMQATFEPETPASTVRTVDEEEENGDQEDGTKLSEEQDVGERPVVYTLKEDAECETVDMSGLTVPKITTTKTSEEPEALERRRRRPDMRIYRPAHLRIQEPTQPVQQTYPQRILSQSQRLPLKKMAAKEKETSLSKGTLGKKTEEPKKPPQALYQIPPLREDQGIHQTPPVRVLRKDKPLYQIPPLRALTKPTPSLAPDHREDTSLSHDVIQKGSTGRKTKILYGDDHALHNLSTPPRGKINFAARVLKSMKNKWKDPMHCKLPNFSSPVKLGTEKERPAPKTKPSTIYSKSVKRSPKPTLYAIPQIEIHNFGYAVNTLFRLDHDNFLTEGKDYNIEGEFIKLTKVGEDTFRGDTYVALQAMINLYANGRVVSESEFHNFLAPFRGTEPFKYFQDYLKIKFQDDIKTDEDVILWLFEQWINKNRFGHIYVGHFIDMSITVTGIHSFQRFLTLHKAGNLKDIYSLKVFKRLGFFKYVVTRGGVPYTKRQGSTFLVGVSLQFEFIFFSIAIACTELGRTKYLNFEIERQKLRVHCSPNTLYVATK